MRRISGITTMAVGLWLTFGVEPSWAQRPPNNDISDGVLTANTGGGTAALKSLLSGKNNTAYGSAALRNTTTGSSNTAFGDLALNQNASGGNNTAVGDQALTFNIASDNTAVGASALFSNFDGTNNTAAGASALRSNTTGSDNIAVGASALLNNTNGGNNIAVGSSALRLNSGGFENVAVGGNALPSNTTGGGNIAVGFAALNSNTTGGGNIAIGVNALERNTTGTGNAAVGGNALILNITGANNTAIGETALRLNTAGTDNIGLGHNAGSDLTSGNSNIYLGNAGSSTESNTMRLGQIQTRTFIAGIAGTPLSGSQVVVSNSGQLGILPSSARYKRDIEPMAARSLGLFRLRPVTFRYTQDDPQGIRQYGLVAEEVAKVYPELVTQGSDGRVESVQYHELVPMLVNELQRQTQELGDLKAQNEALRAALVQLRRQDKARWTQTTALTARLARLEKVTHSGPLAGR